jgi:hypothetical protein
MYSTIFFTKNLSLYISYIFPKFDESWKNEDVMFLMVPPNCTYTRNIFNFE